MKYPRVRLTTLDQDAFDVDATKLVDFPSTTPLIYLPNGAAISRRGSGNLAGKGLFLPTGYEYKVVTDSEGYPVLIVIKI